MLVKVDIHMPKNETRPLHYTTHKNKPKMDYRLKCKAWNYKIPKTKHRDCGLGSDFFFGYDTQSIGDKSQNRQVGLRQTKKLLYNKGDIQWNEKVTYEVGENICQTYIL